MGADRMQLGNFSVSLAVKDIKASKAFYEKLDFHQVFGNLEQHFVIMQNGTTTIGLFQGMFEKNVLTFNPGWNHKMEALEKFQDVRDLQADLVDVPCQHQPRRALRIDHTHRVAVHVGPHVVGEARDLLAPHARRRRLEAGSFKLMGFYEDVDVLEVPPAAWRRFDPEGVSFHNLNRDEDLARAEALLRTDH